MYLRECITPELNEFALEINLEVSSSSQPYSQSFSYHFFMCVFRTEYALKHTKKLPLWVVTLFGTLVITFYNKNVGIISSIKMVFIAHRRIYFAC